MTKTRAATCGEFLLPGQPPFFKVELTEHVRWEMHGLFSGYVYTAVRGITIAHTDTPELALTHLAQITIAAKTQQHGQQSKLAAQHIPMVLHRERKVTF